MPSRLRRLTDALSSLSALAAAFAAWGYGPIVAGAVMLAGLLTQLALREVLRYRSRR